MLATILSRFIRKDFIRYRYRFYVYIVIFYIDEVMNSIIVIVCITIYNCDFSKNNDIMNHVICVVTTNRMN